MADGKKGFHIKTGFIVLLFFILAAVQLFAGGGQEKGKDTQAKELPARTIEIDKKLEAEAVRLILDHLDHPSLAVRKAAVEGVRYIPGRGDSLYNEILPLLGDLSFDNNLPGVEFLKYTIIETLFTLDQERTIRLLLESNDYVLSTFNLFRLFSIIGFDAVPLFDNLFYYVGYNEGSIPFFPILCAELYEAQGEDKYLEQIIFNIPGDMTPDEYFFIYNYLTAKGLPADRLEFLLLEKGGRSPFVSSPVRNDQIGRAYTLKELLYQAVLYRIGSSGEVYKTEYIDPKEYVFSSYIPLIAMTAELYAGIEPAEPVSLFLELFDSVQSEKREAGLEIAAALRDAPYTPYRENLLSQLLSRRDNAVRRLAAEGLARTAGAKFPNVFMDVLRRSDDPYLQGVGAEGLGKTKNRILHSLLIPLFTGQGEDRGPVLPVVAAGQYLRLFTGEELK